MNVLFGMSTSFIPMLLVPHLVARSKILKRSEIV
jgi:hypothetical protein